jgi:[ribosomal protein S5]-alanine N-acetyltransferase
MPKITLRNQRVSDAKVFYEILSNPNFLYLRVCPKSIAEEKKFLRANQKKRRNNIDYNYTILYDGKIIGACGIKIDQHRKYIGEIGYFIDEEYWGRGIATKAVRLLEKIAFKKMGLKRIEILMDPRNIGSEKVAIKCNYNKEGTLRKAIMNGKKFTDAYLYAKVR